jgi:hypothetical protein
MINKMIRTKEHFPILEIGYIVKNEPIRNIVINIKIKEIFWYLSPYLL